MANMFNVKFSGMSAFKRAARKEKGAYEKRFTNALKVMGLFVQRESQKIVPVDTANLKRTAFTRNVGTGHSPIVLVGYTANYAIYVHENTEAAHKSGKFDKFLQRIVTDKKSEMYAVFFAAMKA